MLFDAALDLAFWMFKARHKIRVWFYLLSLAVICLWNHVADDLPRTVGQRSERAHVNQTGDIIAATQDRQDTSEHVGPECGPPHVDGSFTSETDEYTEPIFVSTPLNTPQHVVPRCDTHNLRGSFSEDRHPITCPSSSAVGPSAAGEDARATVAHTPEPPKLVPGFVVLHGMKAKRTKRAGRRVQAAKQKKQEAKEAAAAAVATSATEP
ncbi:hypothetical protein NM688_g2088 [Phlebia brevispora]|uniref:Uncharacterized protein n=1 Tax=Phlebia brevispora TaxID=194682 RepID=A0ACC1T9A2_9APHY|nr:hypothetical protein NM688_g2088 [Phlebia brevispora]